MFPMLYTKRLEASSGHLGKVNFYGTMAPSSVHISDHSEASMLFHYPAPRTTIWLPPEVPKAVGMSDNERVIQSH